MKILKFSVGPMMTNCYLLICEQTHTCAVVDPGGDEEKMLDRIASKGLTVSAILLTHGHFDHIMALPFIKKATNAPLFLHEDDAFLYGRNDLNCMHQFAGIDVKMPPPDHLLVEGDTITIGSEIVHVLHTPGHTPGSVCYVTSDGILTGDTLFKGACGRSDMYGGDFKKLLASLSRLKDLSGDPRLFPGHGASTHLEKEKVENPYLN